MKAILEFSLPEENAEHIRAVHCYDAWNALSDIREMIRRYHKYNECNESTLIENINRAINEADRWIGD